LLHDEGERPEMVAAYIRQYALSTADEAAKTVQFLSHPMSRSYIYTYTQGAELLDRAFERLDPKEVFTRVLHEPVTPSMLRAWGEKGAGTE
jgi:hypothetical protein